MKHIKLFKEHQNDDEWEKQWEAYEGLDDDIESILVELKDFGLDYSISHNSGMSESISIEITAINDEDTFWFDNRLYERLVFLTEYLTKKYPNILVQVKDDFIENYQEFPFSIEEFSDEIMSISIQIYYGE